MLAAGLLVALQTVASGTPERRPLGWDDFPVFVWRERYAGKPLPDALAAPFGGVLVMRDEDPTWARERGLAYLVWNVAGREPLHLDADDAWNARVERWIETRDEELLVRAPCPSDPATVARLEATLDATLAKHGAGSALGFVLGDEVALTPGGAPFDACRCAACEARWRAYAREHDWPESAPLTDEVRLARLDGDAAPLGAWLARGRFAREQLEALVAALATRVHDRAPALPVGLLGISAPAPFGGIDLASGLRALDFVEAYPVGDARELLLPLRERMRRDPYGYSVGRRRRGSLATIFVADESPDACAWLAWEHWLRGGTGVVLWSDGALAARPAHVARLADAVGRIRALEHRFPRLQSPSVDGVLLVHDADSRALAWLDDALLDGPTWPRRGPALQEEHGTVERATRARTRLIEDQGLLPAAVALARLREVCPYGCTTLVLPHVSVVGSEDVTELERQLDLGATLVVDGAFARVDRRGTPWTEDVFERLARRAPGRVLRAPPDVGDYPVRRLEKGTTIPAAIVAALVARRRSVSVHGGGVPWRTSFRMTGPVVGHTSRYEYLVTALPNLAGRTERARLAPIRAEVSVPDACTLEWLHPEDGGELPAGDAAVFLLREEVR